MSAVEAGNNTLLKIQETNAELKALTYGKYLVSGAMIAEGILTGNPLLVAGGVLLSQVPTGRVVNKTDSYVAASTEHSKAYGDVYLAPHSTTYTASLDNIIGAGEKTGVSVKLFPGSDVTVKSNSDIDLSLGTQIVNLVGNVVKANEKHSSEKKGTKPSITVEPFGKYKNKDLLSEQGIPKVNGFSNEVKKFAENNSYMTESGIENK